MKSTITLKIFAATDQKISQKKIASAIERVIRAGESLASDTPAEDQDEETKLINLLQIAVISDEKKIINASVKNEDGTQIELIQKGCWNSAIRETEKMIRKFGKPGEKFTGELPAVTRKDKHANTTGDEYKKRWFCAKTGRAYIAHVVVISGDE